VSGPLGVLLHVGFPKAGSSYLQEWFARHPALAYRHHGIGGLSSSVDIHELADARPSGTVRWLVTSDEDLAFWKGPLDPVGARIQPYDVSGHRQRVCQLLATLHPNATVLVVTRGYATIAASAYSQYLRIGGVLTFREWCREHGDLMSRYWNYDELVRMLIEQFGADRVVVLPWELLDEDADQFLAIIAGRLGIEPRPGTTVRLKASIPLDEHQGYRRLSNLVLRATAMLSPPRRRAIYQRYVAALSADGWRRARSLAGMGRFDPHREAVEPEWLSSTFGGQAEVLRDLPYYADYRAEYLLTP
jgi:hypothetical protein